MDEQKPRDMVASAGYCFSDGNHLLQSYEAAPEIYSLAAGVDMIGFQQKNLHPETTVVWKGGYYTKAGSGTAPSTSMEISEPASSHEFYHHEFNKKHDLTAISGTTNETLMVSPDSWNHHENRLIVDDPSLRCVFTCEGNERPSQGLSLSLSSSHPSTIGLQSFELRQHDDLQRFGPSSSRSVNFEHPPPVMQGYSHVKNSKYLGPAQEILNEFCNLGISHNDTINSKMKNSHEFDDEVKKQSQLLSLDLLELQRRKNKLLQMLDEVDRRYRQYCDQMKSVRSSFEAVAGSGAATVYSLLASRAMSRHFRSLRDGIVREIKGLKKAMGEKEVAAPGSVKGETPRLRVLDQTLRQQKALQQMSIMDNHPWRPQRGLPERSVSVLRAWLFEHFLHPYPSDVDKHILARQTGLSRSQVSNWFINARVRLWKPMVEEMYIEEQKESGGPTGTSASSALNDNGLNQNRNDSRNEDEKKPSQEQLVRIDSECLSSIINANSDKNAKKSKTLLIGSNNNNNNNNKEVQFGRAGEDQPYAAAMELDFSSYNHESSAYGGGVSLTLGLHQHGEGGLAFSSTPSTQSSLYYGRDPHHHHHHQMDQTSVQYSLLDTENQSLQYRNLMGAQLLHDLAG